MRKTTNILIGVVALATLAMLELSKPKTVQVSHPADPKTIDADNDPARPCYPDCRADKDADQAFMKRYLRMTAQQRAYVEIAIEQEKQIETIERVGGNRAAKCPHARIAADAWLAAAEDDRYRAAARRVTEWCS